MERVKLKSGKGGYRPGSGRKPGSANRRLAQDNIDKAAAHGMLPHEFLLAIVRGERITRTIVEIETDGNGDPVEVVREVDEKYDFKDRQVAARDAAPYYAPRISTVEVITGVADDDLDAIIASLAKETGLSTGPVGEGTQAEGVRPEAGSTSSSRTLLKPD